MRHFKDKYHGFVGELVPDGSGYKLKPSVYYSNYVPPNHYKDLTKLEQVHTPAYKIGTVRNGKKLAYQTLEKTIWQ